MKTELLYSESPPTEAQIQHAAYLLWIENGRPEGRDLEHWLAAKELLHHRHGRSVIRPANRRTKTANRPTALGQN